MPRVAMKSAVALRFASSGGHVAGNSTGGGQDAFVAKVDATGSTLVYAGYIGGERGDGAYELGVNTLGGRWSSEVVGGPEWRTVEIPFTALKPAQGRGGAKGAWTATDLLEVSIGGSRTGGYEQGALLSAGSQRAAHESSKGNATPMDAD